ncbi:hypothetical protein AAEH72_04200 [Shewanella xiamenensis]
MITAILEGDIPLGDADSHRTFTRLWRPVLLSLKIKSIGWLSS